MPKKISLAAVVEKLKREGFEFVVADEDRRVCESINKNAETINILTSYTLKPNQQFDGGPGTDFYVDIGNNPFNHVKERRAVICRIDIINNKVVLIPNPSNLFTFACKVMSKKLGFSVRKKAIDAQIDCWENLSSLSQPEPAGWL